MDTVCINPLNFTTPYVFSSEHNFATGETKTAVCFIKVPPKSPLIKYCYDISEATDKNKVVWGQIGPNLFDEAVKKFNLTQYTLPWWDMCPIGWDNMNKIFSPQGSRLQDFKNSTHIIHLWGECIRSDDNEYDIDHPKLDSLYLELISNNFKLTGFTTVTEPFKTGYPILECAKSCLSILDEFYVIYGRDEKQSRKQLEELGVKCIVTNKWGEDWIYSDMTYHMDLGLKESGGDLCFKIDSDYIMSLNDNKTATQYRMQLFQYINSHYLMYIPKINYMPYNFFLMIEKSIYCINKHLLDNHNIKYEIAVDNDNYVNRLFIHSKNADDKTIVTKDLSLAIYNYDCSEMTRNQYLYKQRGWFNAFHKLGGDISKFGLTKEKLDDDKQLMHEIKRRFYSRVLWAIKKEQIYHEKLDYNPPEIRRKINALSKYQYGHSHFDDVRLRRALENYMFIYKGQVMHLKDDEFTEQPTSPVSPSSQ